jgi:hypothetical protein
MENGNRRLYLIKVFAVWATLVGLILAIGALRTADQLPSSIGAIATNPTQEQQDVDSPNPSSRKRDYLKQTEWPEGMRLYRDWGKHRQTAICIAEMDRRAKNLEFGVALANDRIIERERISDIERRLAQRGVPMFAGVNASFGIREDNLGRGGVIFNLHIEDWELVSIPTRRDRWGYSPPSPWGETSFGVTPDGEFLVDAVQLNGVVRINGQELKVDGVNQLLDSGCPVVIYTPRFGDSTLTRYGYEVTLKELELPLKGEYRSRFVIASINAEGDSLIPPDGVVLALDRRTSQQWQAALIEGAAGELEIALTPTRWRQARNGVGGNIRLLRNGEIEPEVVKFYETDGGYAPHQSNGANLNPRSALAFNDDKLFLVVVDGRQMGYSLGMTFYELARFLKDLGAKEAINFDGGSSSTLWGLGDIVNKPSHGYERSVFNVAMITAPKGELTKRKENEERRGNE